HPVAIFGVAQDGNHSRLFVDRVAELLGIFHFDDFHTHHPNGMVIHVTAGSGHDHFVLEGSQIGKPLHFLRVSSSNTGGGYVSQSSRTSSRDNSELGPRQLSQTQTHLFH